MAVDDLVLLVEQEGWVDQGDGSKTGQHGVGGVVDIVFGCIGISLSDNR